MINEVLARTYWPDGDALGKHFKRPAGYRLDHGDRKLFADARTESLAATPVPEL